MTARLSPEAARMARARKDFVEAMARGCSIIDLRAARAGCSRRVEQESPVGGEPTMDGKQGFVVIDEAADFDRWDCQHMMRD